MASYASNSSTAIDYRRFATDQTRPEQPLLEVLPGDRRAKKPQQAKTPYGKLVLIGACIFAVLALIIFSYMTANVLTVENDRLRGQIAGLQSRENALNAKKEQLYNLAFVENYAKMTLGMVKLDKSEIRYIGLQNPERMTVAQGEPTSSAAIAALARSFSAVLEYLN